ncbi:chorismate mutase [Bdellovibrio bacteriovorus]|uniref:chorismate mutase n=1 Tax=Bdellovibrio bacteriovorus TaxID=959 RepID=UPI0021CFD1AD|nr:chorismate mutase [Bdellovibrio bacteriovorus]UXR66208.1 chorismate mutase [Bdellovibrio bacteriovorus]
MDSIASLRQEIDQVHKELHALLLRRRELTVAVWKIKQEQGRPFFSPEREEQIIQNFVNMEPHQPRDPQFDELLKGVMNSILREYEKYLKSQF